MQNEQAVQPNQQPVTHNQPVAVYPQQETFAERTVRGISQGITNALTGGSFKDQACAIGLKIVDNTAKLALTWAHLHFTKKQNEQIITYEDKKTRIINDRMNARHHAQNNQLVIEARKQRITQHTYKFWAQQSKTEMLMNMGAGLFLILWGSIFAAVSSKDMKEWDTCKLLALIFIIPGVYFFSRINIKSAIPAIPNINNQTSTSSTPVIEEVEENPGMENLPRLSAT